MARRPGYDDQKWQDNRTGKHNDWLTTNTQFLLPRVAYPAHRTHVAEGPLYPRRSPYVGVVASRYPVYTTGGFGDKGPGDGDSEASFAGNEDKKKKSSRFRLCITLVIFFVLVAVALAIVAIYLAVRNNDTEESYTGTYEATVRMAQQKFTDKLDDVTSTEYSEKQKEFCSKTEQSFDGAVKNCIVDAFSNGSLVVASTLDFDLDKLETLVKKRGFVPSEGSIITTLQRVFTTMEDDVTIKLVRKEPEFLTFRLRTWMNINDTENNYCNAIKVIYGDSFEHCELTGTGVDHVNCTIQLKTKVMKNVARSDKSKSDKDGIRSVVLYKLVNNKVEFFTSRQFIKDQSEVDDFKSKTDGDTSNDSTAGTTTTATTANGDTSSDSTAAASETTAEETAGDTTSPSAATTTPGTPTTDTGNTGSTTTPGSSSQDTSNIGETTTTPGTTASTTVESVTSSTVTVGTTEAKTSSEATSVDDTATADTTTTTNTATTADTTTTADITTTADTPATDIQESTTGAVTSVDPTTSSNEATTAEALESTTNQNTTTT